MHVYACRQAGGAARIGSEQLLAAMRDASRADESSDDGIVDLVEAATVEAETEAEIEPEAEVEAEPVAAEPSEAELMLEAGLKFTEVRAAAAAAGVSAALLAAALDAESPKLATLELLHQKRQSGGLEKLPDAEPSVVASPRSTKSGRSGRSTKSRASGSSRSAPRRPAGPPPAELAPVGSRESEPVGPGPGPGPEPTPEPEPESEVEPEQEPEAPKEASSKVAALGWRRVAAASRGVATAREVAAAGPPMEFDIFGSASADEMATPGPDGDMVSIPVMEQSSETDEEALERRMMAAKIAQLSEEHNAYRAHTAAASSAAAEGRPLPMWQQPMQQYPVEQWQQQSVHAARSVERRRAADKDRSPPDERTQRVMGSPEPGRRRRRPPKARGGSGNSHARGGGGVSGGGGGSGSGGVSATRRPPLAAGDGRVALWAPDSLGLPATPATPQRAWVAAAGTAGAGPGSSGVAAEDFGALHAEFVRLRDSAGPTDPATAAACARLLDSAVSAATRQLAADNFGTAAELLDNAEQLGW